MTLIKCFFSLNLLPDSPSLLPFDFYPFFTFKSFTLWLPSFSFQVYKILITRDLTLESFSSWSESTRPGSTLANRLVVTLHRLTARIESGWRHKRNIKKFTQIGVIHGTVWSNFDGSEKMVFRFCETILFAQNSGQAKMQIFLIG